MLKQFGSGGFVLTAQALQAPLNVDRCADPLYTHHSPIVAFARPRDLNRPCHGGQRESWQPEVKT
jgi:hypothetical protein